MKKFILGCCIIALAVQLTACETIKTMPTVYKVSPEERYIPINLDINAGRYVTPSEAEVVEYIYQCFGDSNLFSNLDTRYGRWRYAINVKYTWEQPTSIGNLSKVLVSSATLLLVPTKMEEIHRLEVDIVDSLDIVKSFNYEQVAKVSMSLNGQAVEDRKLAINELLKDFYNDLIAHKPIPKIKDIANQNSDPPI